MNRMWIYVATACSVLIGVINSRAGDKQAGSVPAGSAAESSQQKIYIDPATGKKSPPPVATPALTPGLTNRVSTSAQGLTEVPVTEKPGGFKVHLGGRFQSTLTASNGVDGKAAVRCLDGPEQILSKPTTPDPKVPAPKK